MAYIYSAGTITVTQGQTLVVGQGTAWATVVPDMTLLSIDGTRAFEIAEVVNDNQIRLALPWPGQSVNRSSYTISSYIGSTTNGKTLTHADSPYTLLPTDYFLWCDTTDGDIAINPPVTTVANKSFLAKSIVGDGTVTFGMTIDGNATPSLTGLNDSRGFAYNGASWSFLN